MMRMRPDGSRKPCATCGALTGFEKKTVGPRGADKGWKPTCPECGERGGGG